MRGGGAEHSMLNLARGVVERGYAMYLVLARAEGLFLSGVPGSVRVVDLEASRVLMSLPALVRYLRRERPLAMLAVLKYANVVALWARRPSGTNLRLVVSERNTLSRATQHALSQRARLMPQLIRRFYSAGRWHSGGSQRSGRRPGPCGRHSAGAYSGHL